jgi:diacylglycerol kinase family enzyme
MKVLVILNGISRRKKFFYQQLLPALQSAAATEVHETTFAGHAEALALEAANQQQWDAVLAAGGDGTLSQVLNGLMQGPANKPALGLIPLGSGNDFARTVNARAEAKQLKERLLQSPQPIDVGFAQLRAADGATVQRYFINVCSVGMGPEVVGRIVNDRSGWGPGVVYLKAIVNTFLSLKPAEVHV